MNVECPLSTTDETTLIESVRSALSTTTAYDDDVESTVEIIPLGGAVCPGSTRMLSSRSLNIFDRIDSSSVVETEFLIKVTLKTNDITQVLLSPTEIGNLLNDKTEDIMTSISAAVGTSITGSIELIQEPSAAPSTAPSAVEEEKDPILPTYGIAAIAAGGAVLLGLGLICWYRAKKSVITRNANESGDFNDDQGFIDIDS